MQNKALDKSTKFAYIVLDDKRISKTQSKYFESNNIGVVNLHNMPLINDIPHDLTNEIGKRLYSFLRIIDDASLERYLGKLVSYDEAVNAIGKYKYVNSQNICNLLYLGTYSTTGNELTIFSEANYDSLVNYFNIKSENALALKQHFINAGIRNIRLISTSTTRRNEKYDIEDTFHNTILDNKLFVAYINNNYIGLIIQLNSETIEGVFESAFYTTLVKDYISQVFEWYDDMKEVELTIEQKIRYLFNKATLESKKTYNRFDASSLERYIDGIPDVNQKKLYQSYKDILSGNYQKLFDIEKALEKLKEQYNNENYSFIGCSSLQELYKIKKVAIDQYLFYFNNTLFFKGFSDLKKILKVYIEAIICTNGQFQEITSTKWGGVSKKDRYEIDAIDFDIITKFISIKDLYNLLKEYKVEFFKTLDENVDYFVSCLDNITKTVTQLKLYDRLGDIPQTLINCLLLLTHLSINDKQTNVLGEIVINLMTDSEFVEFFFSINCPDHFVSLKIMNSFLKALPKQHNLDIVKKIILNPNFKSYYINIDTYGLRNLLSHFIDIETVPSAQDELVDFISSFEGKDKMNVIRLLYKHIKKPELQRQYTVYINTHFDLLDNDDVLDFAFNDLLEITPELEQKIFDGAIKLYQTQQNSAIHSFPDPMESKMELIYILFIVGKIQDLSPLKDIAKDNDFLQFFLDDGFDYSKIDFSNYMWQNIARQERFHDKFIAHKQEIIPNIKHKIDLGTITDFESKMLYGILLEPEELFNK